MDAAQVIANETWFSMDANLAHSRISNEQKRGQEQIAESHRAVGSKVHVLDSLLSAVADGRATSLTTASGRDGAGKPQLPNPNNNSTPFDGADGAQMGLISIIGAVLALQAKSNSNFWQTLWQQASQSMLIQVKFAPIVGQAIQDQYLAQSNATGAQAKQAFGDAFISLAMFTLTMVTAGAMEKVDTLDDTGPKDDAVAYGRNNAPPPVVEQAPELQDDAAQATNEKDAEGWWDSKGRDWDRFKKEAEPFMKKASSFLGRGLQAAQLTSMISQFGTGLNGSTQQEEQAKQQKLEGEQSAVSQQGQMYAQFYGQDFSRMEELRQSCSQHIDNAMNILQQAANTITQTTTSMFRG